MPENSDFSLLADMGAPGERDLPESATTPQFGDELRNALEPTMREPLQKFRDLQSHIVVMNKAAEIPSGPTKQTVKTDPKTGQRTWSGEMPAEAAEAYFRNSQAYQQMLGGYAQQMAQIEQQLRMQEQAIRSQPPWVQLATALAGNLAQAKDMPGWVQGLGRTAAQLNPRPEEIQARRMKVLGEEAKVAGVGAELGIRQETLGLEKAREERLTRESAINQRAKFQTENVNAAIRGEGDPSAVTALGVQMGVIPPDQAPTFQKNLEAMKASYFEKKDADEKTRMLREIQVASFKASLEAETQARLFTQQATLLDKRLATMMAINDKKTADAAAKAEAKKVDLTAAETKDMEKWIAADRALDEVEAILKTDAAKKIMGPYTGRLALAGAKYAPKFADPNGVVLGMEGKLKLQTALAIQSTGAGARGFGPMERPFFEGLAEGLTKTPEQNQKIIAYWREYLDQNRRGVMANHTPETVQKYPKMFGPRLAGPVTSSDSGPVISKDDYDEWLKNRGKK